MRNSCRALNNSASRGGECITGCSSLSLSLSLCVVCRCSGHNNAMSRFTITDPSRCLRTLLYVDTRPRFREPVLRARVHSFGSSRASRGHRYPSPRRIWQTHSCVAANDCWYSSRMKSVLVRLFRFFFFPFFLSPFFFFSREGDFYVSFFFFRIFCEFKGSVARCFKGIWVWDKNWTLDFFFFFFFFREREEDFVWIVFFQEFYGINWL